MKLSVLCDALKSCRILSKSDPDIVGVTNDSRRTKPGGLFVAVVGYEQDGHAYVRQAIEKGAVAVVVERRVVGVSTVPQVLVRNSRDALSALSDKFNGEPSRKLEICGVTGTKGKTTTTFLIHAISEASGCPTGMLGTIGYRFGRRHIPATGTTPESVELHNYLAQMVEANLRRAVVEVSSHALALSRVSHIRFRTAVLTNVMRNEHTDFHKTFAHYRASKAFLFATLKKGQVAILNRDDPSFDYFVERTGAEVISYGMCPEADIQGEVLCSSLSESVVRVKVFGRNSFEVKLRLIGNYNVSNLLAASGAALAMGAPESAIQRGLETLSQVPGRLEPVNCGQDYTVLVDYAHTADSLHSVLKTLRAVAKRRLIVLFGCGGNRDKTKRPLMGRAASTGADFTWITSDNSRNEKTKDIINQIKKGLVSRAEHQICHDRAGAIRGAIEMAAPGDIVLLAGKGHETYQILGDITYPFDDRIVAREAILNRMDRESRHGRFSSVAAL